MHTLRQAMTLFSMTWLAQVTSTLCLILPVCCTVAANPMPATVSAQEIADRLSEIRQDGMSYVRLRMEIKTAQPSAKTALQLQIKARRTKSMSDLVIQVLWPKERKGEAVLLHQTNGSFPTGMLLLLPDTQRPLDASQMGKPLFGGDLSYEDFIDNFFAWHHQSIIGSEMLGGVSCVVLESKPGKGEKSSYASVKSWIDPVRMVPHRVEKYFEGGAAGMPH